MTTQPKPIARFEAPKGAVVAITHEPYKGGLLIRCNGCLWHESVWTEDRAGDTARETDARIAVALPEAREYAQAHAEKCRALPPEDGTR